jgi:hypothetical protein
VIVQITKQTPTKTYNGFAIPLQPNTDLGVAVLVAEDEEGHYEPVTGTSSRTNTGGTHATSRPATPFTTNPKPERK